MAVNKGNLRFSYKCQCNLVLPPTLLRDTFQGLTVSTARQQDPLSAAAYFWDPQFGLIIPTCVDLFYAPECADCGCQISIRELHN